MLRVEKIVAERYNGAKVDNFFCYAYNDALVSLVSLDKAGTTDVEAWRAAVLDISDFDGLDGPFKIRREDRNVERPFHIAVDDGTRNFKVIY
jgi:hypothetical protein